MTQEIATLNFASGVDVGTPVSIAKLANKLQNFASHAAFVAANGAATEGATYWNTTEKAKFTYDGVGWQKSALPHARDFQIMSIGKIRYSPTGGIQSRTPIDGYLANQNGANDFGAQQFTPSSTIDVTSVDIGMKVFHGVTSDMRVDIYSDSAGQPGTLVYTGDLVSFDDETYPKYSYVRFPVAGTITSGVIYWFILKPIVHTSGTIRIGTTPHDLGIGPIAQSSNTGSSWTVQATETACFGVNDLATYVNLSTVDSIYLSAQGIPIKANYIASQILFTDVNQVAYVTPNLTLPGGELTLSYGQPEDVGQDDFIVATMKQGIAFIGGQSIHSAASEYAHIGISPVSHDASGLAPRLNYDTLTVSGTTTLATTWQDVTSGSKTLTPGFWEIEYYLTTELAAATKAVVQLYNDTDSVYVPKSRVGWNTAASNPLTNRTSTKVFLEVFRNTLIKLQMTSLNAFDLTIHSTTNLGGGTGVTGDLNHSVVIFRKIAEI